MPFFLINGTFFVTSCVNLSAKYHLNIQIDKLTNSIVNIISGDSFLTEVLPVTKAELKKISKKTGWLFSWQSEARFSERQIFKLIIENNENIIQGLVSISDFKDHYYLHLVESAPFNFGKNKLYEGVPGNLFAYACKLSWDKGYQGFVSFTSKTRLIAHYQKSLGAVHVGAQKMLIFPNQAIILINRYYPLK